MATKMPQDQFAAFNVDPALAEMVEEALPDQLLEGILRLDDPSDPPPGFVVVSKFNRICTGRFRAADAWKIRRDPNVISLKAARPVGIHDDDDPLIWPWQDADPHRKSRPRFTGRGSIVAALDFGFDFAHPNFLNRDGTTRAIAFWHQGADYDPAHPNRFGYGRQYSSEEINAALGTPDPYRALRYHPAGSDGGLGSHGTHTLDIAAGNGRARGSTPSAAPDAAIIFVHLSTPRLDVVGDLGDSVRLLEALDYVDETANGRPWAANLSVGRTAGSHDGTSPVEQGMHELLRRGPSRAIVQSAGNYRSANLAVEGWLRDGEHRDLEWNINPADTTANEMDGWYSGKDRFVVAVRAPGAREFTKVRLGEVADLTHRGSVVGRIYHRRDDPNNHDNHFEVFLHKGAPPGTWTVRLIGDYVISGRFHAWIERDLARPGAQSRFDKKITSTRYTLGTIATSPLAITVGAYDAGAADKSLAHFSSLGPTRDDRHDKPEILAPGVNVVAARSIPRGAASQQGLLVARSGTSMAAPHVTGTVAAMFEAAGRPVSIDVIRECLRRSAERVKAGKDGIHSAWGRLDVARAIDSIRALAAPKGAPMGEGVAMNSNAMSRVFEQVERALATATGDRRQSESAFLQQLLRTIDGGDYQAGLSPAALFRGILHGKPAMTHVRRSLEVLAFPSQRPADALRPGDWMLRSVPGTGDVGHISVLASDDLLTRSMLASEGIDSESTQPGFYGLVMEVGTRPRGHTRSIARRLLDSRGRVSPHTMFLRPAYSLDSEAPEFPIGEVDQEGGGPTLTRDSESDENFSPPTWFKVEQRSGSSPADGETESMEYMDSMEALESTNDSDDFSPPAWFKVETRTRSGPAESEAEFSEAFTFDPTGAQTDFGPEMRKAWHRLMNATFDAHVSIGLGKLKAGLSINDAAASKLMRFFNPASVSPTFKLTDANVLWRALPIRFGSPTPAIYKALDEPQLQRGQLLRGQDEYCEWTVFRNSTTKKIVRVVFTSEPPEYYKFLYDPGVSSLKAFARKLLVKLYQERCGTNAITLADLERTVGSTKEYDNGNKWNNLHCVHLQHPDNTLGAQINIAARAAVLRSDASGTLITDVRKLIDCDSFGDPDRQSDPTIGDSVNRLARENRFLTLENPVGLYMTTLDTAGWTTPDGTDPLKFWKVLKGKPDKDPRKSMIVRAEFAVPAGKGYTVSDIKIAGVPIDFGSQVAEHVEMRLGARFGPKDQDLRGAKTSAPTPVVC